MNLLITGAAGNLGGLVARYIRDHVRNLAMILMQHRTRIADDLRNKTGIQIRKADLARPETLDPCLKGVDVIVHFAGVLFKANPEKFLYQTNIQYFQNLVAAAKRQKVNRIILISFPHVEGATTKKNPAKGRLDGKPVSIHARTRLAEEKHLFQEIEFPICLRVGMVYGWGILMVDAARWLAHKGLLGVWKTPTQIHLISKTDFCRAVVAAVQNHHAKGIYHVGDDGCDTLQSFLDFACGIWGYRRPRRMPLGLIYLAAELSERFSRLFGTKSPLTRDFIDIGRVSYYGDTRRFRSELLPDLIYRNLYQGQIEMEG